LREITTFSNHDSKIHLLPVIRGLVSEIDEVQRAFSEVKPDAIAVSLSKEEVDGIRNLPEDYEPELSRYDEIYILGLSRYGEVAAPPPCYVAAIETADSEGIPVIPIDIDEASYTELYCASVSGTALFRNSTRTWYLRRKLFAADTPEEYVLRVDRAFNNMSGFRRIEEERSSWMSKELLRASGRARCLLAVVEYERAPAVSRLMEDDLRRLSSADEE
jgi:pheromone shutdown protein TraB